MHIYIYIYIYTCIYIYIYICMYILIYRQTPRRPRAAPRRRAPSWAASNNSWKTFSGIALVHVLETFVLDRKSLGQVIPV